jgi:hypothetical protein
MSVGFYKRRRGILEHLELGSIGLLDLAIHDFLLLTSNLVVGSNCSIPPGVSISSARAIFSRCPKHDFTEREIRRSLQHLEALGWIKRWMVSGKRGNYAIVVCRCSVHDMAGNEYRVSGEKTVDWRKPFLEPFNKPASVSSPACRDGSENDNRASNDHEGIYKDSRRLPRSGAATDAPQFRLEPATDIEVIVESRQKPRSKPAAKTTPPLDFRFQAFREFTYRSFEAKHLGQKPNWNGRDYKNLTALLKKNPSLTLEELKRRWENYSASTTNFIVEQKDSLCFFVSRVDSFIDGPLLQHNFTARKPYDSAKSDAAIRRAFEKLR